MTKELLPTVHIPVLYEETLAALNLAPGKVIVDGTLGGGGHTLAIARAVSPTGLAIGIDRDPKALDRVDARLKSYLESMLTKCSIGRFRLLEDLMTYSTFLIADIPQYRSMIFTSAISL